jgi:hypothetical protein
MKYLCLAYGDPKKMARDLNEAIRVASMHPGARLGEHLGWAVEVRPISEFSHQ